LIASSLARIRFLIVLRELLHDEDMRRPEMNRSKSFVAEIVLMINRQHEIFLKESNSLGHDSLKQAFQQDTTFWNSCAELWGQGSGFLRDNRVEYRWIAPGSANTDPYDNSVG
jgi:hypothetical protein